MGEGREGGRRVTNDGQQRQCRGRTRGGFPASGLYGECLKDNFIYGGLASLSIPSIDDPTFFGGKKRNDCS